MSRLLKRPAVAFMAGALIVAAVFAGRAAYAMTSSEVVHACFKPSNGSLYLIGDGSSRTACQPGDLPISWNVDGPQGLAGIDGQDGADGEDGADGQDGEDFAGSFTSPNGLYSLSVTNSGVAINGPAAGVVLNHVGIALLGASSNVHIGAGVTIDGSTVSVTGSPLTLTCSTGGFPALRTFDVATAVGGDGGPILIGPGAPLTRIC